MRGEIVIIGSYTSPFVRIVRLVAEELSIPYKLELTSFYAKNTKEQEQLIQESNPLMKIPVLIHGDNTVIESRVIIAYLLKNFGGNGDFRSDFPANVAEDNIVSTLYGIIEAGVLRFIMKNTDPDIDMESGYLARSLERMESGLAWLNKQETLGQSFGVPEALLVCGLDWFKKRNVIDWSDYEHLNKVHARFQDRDAVINTRIPEDA